MSVWWFEYLHDGGEDENSSAFAYRRTYEKRVSEASNFCEGIQAVEVFRTIPLLKVFPLVTLNMRNAFNRALQKVMR